MRRFLRVIQFLLLSNAAVLFTGCIGNIMESDFAGSTAVTNDATNITENSVTLNGSVQPNDEHTSVCFLLSGSIDSLLNYSMSLPCITANPATFSPTDKWMTTSARVTGLKSETTYYFCIEILTDHSIFGYKSFTTL